MHNIVVLASALLLSTAGCEYTPNGTTPAGQNPPAPATAATNLPTAKISAVVVGMENSAFAGSCPGAKFDSDRMFKLISQYSKDVVLLQDKAATRAAIVSALTKGVQNSADGLFVFYYSGHGGSDPFPTTGIEETDGRDEYLCPYDTYLIDNDIWKIISKSKGRVFIIADCCHSQTCFRAPKMTLKYAIPLTATWTESGAINMQCWSGCPDDTYSYGSPKGGELTNTLLKYFSPTLTYDELWTKIEADNNLKQFEHVQRTLIGKNFGSLTIFN